MILPGKIISLWTVVHCFVSVLNYCLLQYSMYFHMSLEKAHAYEMTNCYEIIHAYCHANNFALNRKKRKKKKKKKT